LSVARNVEQLEGKANEAAETEEESEEDEEEAEYEEEEIKPLLAKG
jgi:hypothetical protein